MVAQLADMKTGFRPPPFQSHQIPRMRLFAAANFQFAFGNAAADVAAVGRQAITPRKRRQLLRRLRRCLNDNAQLFREQRRQQPGVRIAPVAAHIAAHAAMPGERHLGKARKKAAIAAVVIGKQQAAFAQFAQQAEQARQFLRRIQVGRRAAGAPARLHQARTAEAVFAAAEINQPQPRARRVRAQLRRQRGAHIADRRERRHHQRQRRHHLFIAPVRPPRHLHGQRILADRNRNAEFRAQFLRHRANGVEQRRRLRVVAGGGHPVGRQPHIAQRPHIRRQDVQQRLGHGQAPRRRRVANSHRRALAHRHRLAGITRIIRRRHGNIGDRRLPRPDHLVAHHQPADAAVADGNQERLRRHRRHFQHTLNGVVNADVVQRRRARRAGRRRDRTRATRRVAEQHRHRHVHRVAPKQAICYNQLPPRGGAADDRRRAAFAFAEPQKVRQARGVNRGDITLLRLVAPDFHRRQAAVGARNIPKFQTPAEARAVHQFRQRVGEAAGADIVYRQNRIVIAERGALLDDFLAAPLYLGVVALHRREIQLLRTGAAADRRRRAAAETDQHRRPAEHDQRRAVGKRALGDVARAQRAEAAGDHHRLVITPGSPVGGVLESPEITAQVRAPEFVVVVGAADRRLNHDLQRRGDARGPSFSAFPRLHKPRNTQVGHAEAGQPGLRTPAAPGRRLVADFAAGAGGGAGERRDGGRVVVGLDLYQDGLRLLNAAVTPRFGIHNEAARRGACDDGGVVFIRRQHAVRRAGVRVPDHLKQRLFAAAPVERPFGVEQLVAAVFGVGLREHHQFGVGRRARLVAVVIEQIGDFVRRQREFPVAVDGLQPRARVAVQRNLAQRPGLGARKNTARRRRRITHFLGHSVVQQRRARIALSGAQRAV